MQSNRNYKNLNVNPCKMCMPMGASLALKGIEGAMVIIHGSQGCSTYIRRHIATHFNEPVDIASSSLNEKETVYGGARNLKQGINNVINMYEPKVIGVLTSCLAETIGEDIDTIISDFKYKHNVNDVDIITSQTPGYGASHYQGYFHTLKEIVKYYVKDKKENNKINIITTLLSPAEHREIKRIMELFDTDYILLPDISETLDAPFTNEFNKIPKGGTKPIDIKEMGGSLATIEIGYLLPDNRSPGTWLKEEFGVELYKCPIPIGMEGTDLFIELISKITNNPVPDILKKERGRLLDAMIDSHKYNGEGVACIFGDPEICYSVGKICLENGIKPKIIASGSQSIGLKSHIDLEDLYDVYEDTDFDTIQELVQKQNINILIGHGDGKYIEEKENIPLVRIGFPVHDKVGAQRKCYIGYEGSTRFLDEITNTLLEIKHHGYRNRIKKIYFQKENQKKENVI